MEEMRIPEWLSSEKIIVTSFEVVEMQKLQVMSGHDVIKALKKAVGTCKHRREPCYFGQSFRGNQNRNCYSPP